MKKWICALAALMMICTFALAELESPVRLGFEEGFSLELPEGWRYYDVNEQMAEAGVLYCLSDAEGARWLYIQSWESDCADADRLLGLVNASASPVNSGKYTFNGVDFVVYDLKEGDVSCCATLMNGSILNFVFTPQSDSAFMATAAQVIGTFELI